MTNIIKRRKTANYTQINNFPVQEDLADLAAVGLLTYIMSLPADWTLYKTQLQKAFTRRKVDGAWKVLVEKKYAIGFYAHVNGHKNYFYMASDIAFTEQDFHEFVNETVKEVREEKKATVYNITATPHSPFEIPGVQNAHQEETAEKTPDVQNEQLSRNSSSRAPTKEVPTKETTTKTQPFTIVNEDVSGIPEQEQGKTKEEVLRLCNEFYPEFAPGRWSKAGWNRLIAQFVNETFDTDRQQQIELHKIRGYVYKSLENIARHHDFKTGKRQMGEWMPKLPVDSSRPPLYNWLDSTE